MSRSNWAERFSNQETTVFDKGNWTLKEDGEKTWSLYFNDECVYPVLDFNRYKLFHGSFLMYVQRPHINSYCLFSATDKKPLFTISGQDARVEFDNYFLTFYSGDTNLKTFDLFTLNPVNISNNNQIGLDI